MYQKGDLAKALAGDLNHQRKDPMSELLNSVSSSTAQHNLQEKQIRKKKIGRLKQKKNNINLKEKIFSS
jgi:hypothetical protein